MAKKKEIKVEPEKEAIDIEKATQIVGFTQEKAPLWWFASATFITLIAALFRFWQITLKPLHHDEGVNGFFLTTLFREGIYKYDPTNYHGPTLYYIALAVTKVFGLNTVSIRGSVAVFGVLMVVMIFFLRRYIGLAGSLAAALFIAVSPGMVFISRYFIHEIFFVFCSLGIVLGVLFFLENSKPGYLAIGATILLLMICFIAPVMNLADYFGGENKTLVWLIRLTVLAVEGVLCFYVLRLFLDWNEGRPIYLILSAACAALFFATKETAFITIGTMLIACGCLYIWRKIYDVETVENHSQYLTWKNFSEKVRESNPVYLWLTLVAVFAFVNIVFFSSFFTYSEGISAAFKAYAVWTKTGTGDHTQNGTWAYLEWLGKLELPILILSAFGALVALIKSNNRFAMFASLWGFGLFAAYTIIPYKTPWLALSFILPLCIVAGYAVNEIVSLKNDLFKIFGGAIAVIAAFFLAYQSYDLNFVNYDNNDKPYIYAHTTRGFLNLVEKINYYAAKSGKGENTAIQIVSPDYWSLPWYSRDFKNANYHGQIVADDNTEMIISKKGEQDDEIQQYADKYKDAGIFPLRPGVELRLLVRNDLADKDAKSFYLELPENVTVDIKP